MHPYLEINPLVVLDGVNGEEPQVCYLGMAAKLDQTAESICGPKWAIARDLSVYEATDAGAVKAATGKAGAVATDRGPPISCLWSPMVLTKVSQSAVIVILGRLSLITCSAMNRT